jgi:hypothetical protein
VELLRLSGQLGRFIQQLRGYEAEARLMTTFSA